MLTLESAQHLSWRCWRGYGRSRGIEEGTKDIGMITGRWSTRCTICHIGIGDDMCNEGYNPSTPDGVSFPFSGSDAREVAVLDVRSVRGM